MPLKPNASLSTIGILSKPSKNVVVFFAIFEVGNDKIKVNSHLWRASTESKEDSAVADGPETADGDHIDASTDVHQLGNVRWLGISPIKLWNN